MLPADVLKDTFHVFKTGNFPYFQIFEKFQHELAIIELLVEVNLAGYMLCLTLCSIVTLAERV